jgi:hypothetical protein
VASLLDCQLKMKIHILFLSFKVLLFCQMLLRGYQKRRGQKEGKENAEVTV